MGDILLISTSEDKGGSSEALFPGRVPHVRLSVHGPKKMGRSPFQRFHFAGKGTAGLESKFSHPLLSVEHGSNSVEQQIR
jgi:hypothetical protein